MKPIRTLFLTAAAGAALALGSAQTASAVNLVSNGDFESNTGNGQLGFNTTATAWTTSGYNFLFAPGTADTTGASGVYGGLTLWGPGNGSVNGLPATSPSGGYYVAADGAFDVGAIQQNINGLTVGSRYTVSFFWAGAQQSGFTGPTTDNWTVSLGGNSQTTSTISLPSHGFSGWMSQSFTYTATSTSEVLSFLATGTPSGVPPFALLDGVSMVAAVPEPSTVVAGASALLLLVGGGLRRVFRQKTQA